MQLIMAHIMAVRAMISTTEETEKEENKKESENICNDINYNFAVILKTGKSTMH
jgi:hypothetical protein